MQALGWSIGAVCVSAIDDAGTKLCKGDRGKVVGPGTSAGGDAAQRVLVDYGAKGQVNMLAKEQIITVAEYERQQAAKAAAEKMAAEKAAAEKAAAERAAAEIAAAEKAAAVRPPAMMKRQSTDAWSNEPPVPVTKSAPSAESGPCSQYRVDLTGAVFGQCKCGYAKAEHAPSAFGRGK